MTKIVEAVQLLPAVSIGALIVAIATYKLNRATARRSRFITAWEKFTQTTHYAAVELLLRADSASLHDNRQTRSLARSTLEALESIGRQADAHPRDWEMVLSLEDHRRISALLGRCLPIIGTDDLRSWTPHPAPHRPVFAKLEQAFRTRGSALRILMATVWMML